MIRTNLFKSKFMKAALFGLFLSTFSTGVAFADTNDSKDAAVSTIAVTATSPAKLSDLQAEIDQYVFVDQAEEIKAKEFMVTNTGIIDGYVEVGILPYSDENAKFITDVFGTDNVKVVEGEDVMMYAFDEGLNTTVEDAGETDPELMATSGIATDPAAQSGEGEMVATAYDNNEVTVNLTTDDIQAGRKASPVVIISIAAVIVLLGGTAYVLSHKKVN